MSFNKRIQAFRFYNQFTGNYFSLFQLYRDKFSLLLKKKFTKKVILPATVHKILMKVSDANQTLYYRPLKGDTDVLHEIFFNKVYSFPFRIDEVKTVVDLGAHIGLASLFFASHYKPEKIICVEPMSENFSLLQQNLSQLKGIKVFYENSVISHQSVVGFNESDRAYNAAASTTGNLLLKGMNMQELINKYVISEIDILKIDIEDAERELFAASTQWLEKIRAIVIEIHSEQSEALFLSKVRQLGFEVNRSVTAKDIFFAFNPFFPK